MYNVIEIHPDNTRVLVGEFKTEYDAATFKSAIIHMAYCQSKNCLTKELRDSWKSIKYTIEKSQ